VTEIHVTLLAAKKISTDHQISDSLLKNGEAVPRSSAANEPAASAEPD
jgi:hypothetical protein